MKSLRWMVLAGALAASTPALALDPVFGGARQLTDAELDRMRGGFEISLNGLPFVISFSLDRLTYINGELVAASRLNLDGLVQALTQNAADSTVKTGSLALPQLLATDAASSAVNVVQQGLSTLVQNGPDNQFVAHVDPGALSTVIQNTLDDQLIKSLTVLNARFSQAELELAARMSALDAFLFGR